MILKNSLYTVISKNVVDTSIRYDIHLDANHFIYQAHFPGEPITPGVCILQIAKELLEVELKQQLRIEMVKNIKFLNVISPLEMPEITYVYDKITADDAATSYKVQVQAQSAGVLLAKLSFTCKKK